MAEKNIEQIGKVTLCYECYEGKDLYQDGSEDELLEIVEKHSWDEYE